VFVTLVQDLDRHGAVFDLPADRAELSDLASTAWAARRALMHDAPDLLGCCVHVERIAMFLHPVLPRTAMSRRRSWPVMTTSSQVRHASCASSGALRGAVPCASATTGRLGAPSGLPSALNRIGRLGGLLDFCAMARPER